jgi:hypothetical protein
MGGEGKGWGKRVDEKGQNKLLDRGGKRKKNRSNSKNRKPTIIKLTTTTKNQRNQRGVMNTQTRNKNKPSNKQTPGSRTIEF